MKSALFGEARLRNLIMGLITLFSAIAMILFTHGYTSGMAPGGEIIIVSEGLIILMLCMLILGLMAGYEIGRYVEMEFGKRRRLAGK
jgi:hypothetical protein